MASIQAWVGFLYVTGCCRTQVKKDRNPILRTPLDDVFTLWSVHIAIFRAQKQMKTDVCPPPGAGTSHRSTRKKTLVAEDNRLQPMRANDTALDCSRSQNRGRGAVTRIALDGTKPRQRPQSCDKPVPHTPRRLHKQAAAGSEQQEPIPSVSTCSAGAAG